MFLKSSSSQGSSTGNFDRLEFRSTEFMQFEKVRMSHAVAASENTKHTIPFLESLRQRHKLSYIRGHRDNARIISNGIQKYGCMASLRVQDSFFIFVHGALPHFGSSLGPNEEF